MVVVQQLLLRSIYTNRELASNRSKNNLAMPTAAVAKSVGNTAAAATLLKYIKKLTINQ